jgi:tRNA-Thr(GGU) m(6)t(6)A37 methyltransferase TsaA
MSYEITPVGFIRSGKNCTSIEIQPCYEDAIHGLEHYSHIILLVWFHKRDNAPDRMLLEVHPRRNKNNPLTGIFATRSPVRPNPIAIFMPSIISISTNIIKTTSIDAFDGTPVIDIKPYIPSIDSISGARVPEFR